MNNKPKILIVDDERFYINLLIELLSNDYETVVAKDGPQALLLAQDKPDLILLDVLMPDMDGYEVCQQLKENKSTHDIPVIFLTIKSDLEDEVNGFKLGAVDYINKPISPAILQARVATHIALGQARTKLAEKNRSLINEQQIKDEQLRRSEKMAALGKLTGGIAHDFNNILGIILGYTELLETKLENDKSLEKYIEQILNAVIRGQKTTQKLLAFSRQKSSRPESVDINALLKGDYNMLVKTLTVNIKLNLETDDNICPVWLDENDLQDAILNMCINAMHAMPQGGTLTLTTQRTLLSPADANKLDISAGDYTLLSIKDSGCGMDKNTQQHIFDPFFTTKEDKGTGLGMSQVYGLVQRSSGGIRVESEINHGTCISLYFPCHAEMKKNSEKTHTTPAIEKNSLTGHETILIVDDEPAQRELLGEIFKHHGYNVLTAENPELALGILKTDNIDLIISDVIMPKTDGYTFSSIVHEKYPDIKIQILSGYGEDKHQEDINSSLYQNRIQKPVNANQLLTRIRKLLDS